MVAVSSLCQALIPGGNAIADELWQLDHAISLYSESSFGHASSHIVNDSRVNLEFLRYTQLLTLYGGVRILQDLDISRSQPRTPGSSGYLSAYPGGRIQIPWIPLSFFAEYWTLTSQTGPSHDFRGGAYLYYWRDLSRWSLARKFFSETYAESVYTSRANGNLFTQGWSKIGNRMNLNSRLSSDLYFELFIKRDRLGISTENAQEIRPGLRLNTYFNPITASLSLYYAIGSYASGAAGLPPYSEWRGLLVISGGM